jgi:hypothetical protein
MGNAAPPLKGLLEELQSKFNGSFYTASAVPPSEEMREVKRVCPTFYTYGVLH